MSQCVIQLREEFDQGWEVHMDEEHSVHDVAALLKEFLRDMPDPLLTKELYTAFINTMREDDAHTHTEYYYSRCYLMNSCVFVLIYLSLSFFFFSAVLDYSDQENAIQLLIFLLPPCNSDTLQRLLCLLSTVSAHAEDSLDNEGQEVKKPCEAQIATPTLCVLHMSRAAL